MGLRGAPCCGACWRPAGGLGFPALAWLRFHCMHRGEVYRPRVRLSLSLSAISRCKALSLGHTWPGNQVALLKDTLGQPAAAGSVASRAPGAECRNAAPARLAPPPTQLHMPRHCCGRPRPVRVVGRRAGLRVHGSAGDSSAWLLLLWPQPVGLGLQRVSSLWAGSLGLL